MSGDKKNFGNFDRIKQQMLEAKQNAESVQKPIENDLKKYVENSVEKPVKNYVKNPTEKHIEKHIKESIEESLKKSNEETIIFKKPALKKKILKKAVNYYISEDVIEAIKREASSLQMKDSNFLEELIRQVLGLSE